jgi:methionine-rich copper-binding protein CopC
VNQPTNVVTVRRGVIALVAAVAVLLAGADVVRAHDDIAGSNPPTRSHLDDPITFAEIDFGIEISDDVEMSLFYDLGDGTTEEIGGETTRTGPTTARLDFGDLEREGTYFVRYLAPVPADGHVMAGATSFTWGAPSSSSESFPTIPFVAIAVVVLAVGAWMSWRRMQAEPTDDAEPADTTG